MLPKNTYPGKLTAVVLSGGRGTRVADQDKGLILYQGRPIIETVLGRINKQVDDVIISCNRNISAYQQFGYPCIEDNTEQKFEGPISGILAAADHLSPKPDDLILVTPCDTPSLPSHYVSKLIEPLLASDYQAAAVHDGQRLQSLHCVLKATALPLLQDFFEQGERAIKVWLSSPYCTTVDFSDQADSFANFNYLAQFNY